MPALLVIRDTGDRSTAERPNSTPPKERRDAEAKAKKKEHKSASPGPPTSPSALTVVYPPVYPAVPCRSNDILKIRVLVAAIFSANTQNYM